MSDKPFTEEELQRFGPYVATLKFDLNSSKSMYGAIEMLCQLMYADLELIIDPSNEEELVLMMLHGYELQNIYHQSRKPSLEIYKAIKLRDQEMRKWLDKNPPPPADVNVN